MNCPHCSSSNIIKYGKNVDKKQNHLCKNCKRQFIDEKLRTYIKGVKKQELQGFIIRSLSRQCGIRDIAFILNVNLYIVLKVLDEFKLSVIPKQKKYKSIQVDEVWSYIRKKSKKKWILYAYAPETKEILGYVMGRRDESTVKKLRMIIEDLNVEIENWCTDSWNAFIKVFKDLNHKVGKTFTKAIEGVNCMIRHRMSRLARKTCCFSKTMKNHIAAFEIILQGVHDGTIWSDYSPCNS